jgi:hypothetical protein
MDIEAFWRLIDATRKVSGDDVSRQADLLVDEVVQFSADEILAYHAIMDELMDKAYDAALWDAADIIGCGCSDDGFYEFRGWLIAQGKEVYEKALADPESLIDLIEVNENGQKGHLLHVAITAYKLKTGQEIPPGHGKNPPLKGANWKEEDRHARFPRLAAKFGDCDKRDAMWFGS